MSHNINFKLWTAAEKGDIDSVRRYIKEGANLNYFSGASSVLVIAATSGHREIVKILVANINSPWLRESPFRFLTYKYRFLLEGWQWNCHSKFSIELLAGS